MHGDCEVELARATAGSTVAVGPPAVGAFCALAAVVGGVFAAGLHAAKVKASATSTELKLRIFLDMVHFLQDGKCAVILPL